MMLKRVLRAAATAFHKLLAVGWFFRRPKTYGAHAFALTREGRLVLVKLWYAPGWRLPGGGRDESEPPVDAADALVNVVTQQAEVHAEAFWGSICDAT